MTVKTKPKARSAAQRAPSSLVIRGQGGVSIPLTHPPDLRKKAMKWAYTLRNRIRWATDAEVLRKVWVAPGRSDADRASA